MMIVLAILATLLTTAFSLLLCWALAMGMRDDHTYTAIAVGGCVLSAALWTAWWVG